MKGTEYSPYKAVHHIDRIKTRRPLQCYWLITSRCTYKCPVCINKFYSEFEPSAELNINTTVDIAKQMKDIGLKSISFSGGEPMMYKRFNELLAVCLDMGFDIGIISNGSCIDDVDINLLKQCQWIRFSINSMSNESFCEVHGVEPIDVRGLLESRVKALRSEGCVVGTSYLVQAPNIGPEMYEFAKWSKDAGFDTARFSYYRRKNGDIVYSEEDQTAIQTQLAKAIKLTDEEFEVFGLSSRMKLSRTKNFKHCYMEDIAFCIAANGNVYRCCSLQHRPMGNIGSVMDNTLIDIWNKKDTVDPQKCPMCWHSTKNEFMEYLMDDDPRHVNFI